MIKHGLKQARKDRSRALDELAKARFYRYIEQRESAARSLNRAAMWRQRYMVWMGYDF